MAEDRTTVYEDSHRVDNPLQERTTIRVPLATVDVSFTPRFGVQGAVRVPDVTRSAVVSRNGAPVNFRETFSGLGDSSLLAWYRFRPIHRWDRDERRRLITDWPHGAPSLSVGARRRQFCAALALAAGHRYG